MIWSLWVVKLLNTPQCLRSEGEEWGRMQKKKIRAVFTLLSCMYSSCLTLPYPWCCLPVSAALLLVWPLEVFTASPVLHDWFGYSWRREMLLFTARSLPRLIPSTTTMGVVATARKSQGLWIPTLMQSGWSTEEVLPSARLLNQKEESAAVPWGGEV